MLAKIFLPLFLLAYASSGIKSSSLPAADDIEDHTTVNHHKKDLAKFLEFTKQNLNQSVNPCDDFYTFACGNWKNNQLIPESIRKWSAAMFAEFQFDKLIEEFLKTSSSLSSETTTDAASANKARKFYSSCLAGSKNIEKSMDVVMKYLESKTDTLMKHKNENSNSTFDWIDVNFLFKEFDVHPFIEIDMLKYKNSSGNEISIKYQSQKWFTTFVTMMRNVVSEEMDQGSKIFHHIPQLEAFHRNLSSIIEIKDGQEAIINWTRLLNEEFPDGIDSQWQIHNHVKNSHQFVEFLQNTDKEILIYYAAMKLASDYVDMFKSEVYLPVEKSCLHYTKKYFLSALTPWLIKNIPGAEQWQLDGQKIADHIKFAFLARGNRLKSVEESNQHGRVKLNATVGIFGFTEETKNQSIQDKLFESIQITDDFWQNLFNLKQKTVLDKKNSIIPASALHQAKFFGQKNMFSIPLQFTQMPFYNENFTNLMKYGSLGFLIGHEIGHAFDYDNVKYNYEGKMEKWWTDEAYNYIDQNYQCFIKHFANVEFKNKKLAKGFSKSEVVANVLGAQFAWDAFLKEFENEMSNGNLTEKPFENFDFTWKQLFFIQFAQTQCVGIDLYNFAKFLDSELRAVEPFRVNGLLQNMPEFNQAYQCPVGSNLNPETKCVLWGN